MSKIEYASRREFDVFAASAPEDADFMQSVVDWMEGSCGLAMAPLDGDPGRVSAARTFIFVVSRASLHSASLIRLITSASDEVQRRPGLRLIGLVRHDVADSELPPIIAEHKVVRASEGGFTTKEAVAVLEAIYPVSGELEVYNRRAKDVYFSRTWLHDTDEGEAADRVYTQASRLGFRLVGDTEDQEFDPVVRLREIMATCGGFIAVLPYRGDTCGTSEWMLEEIRLASSSDLPSLIVKDSKVPQLGALISVSNTIGPLDYSPAPEWSAHLDTALEDLWNRYRQPDKPANVLYLSGHPERIAKVKALVFGITAMSLTTLDQPLRDRAMLLELVQHAGLVICDLSRGDAEGWIAAGCAVAMNREVEVLISESVTNFTGFPSLSPIHRYNSELDYFGKLHRILRRHRRKLIDSALSATGKGN